MHGPLAVLAAPSALCLAYFTFADALRKAQADILAGLGLAPEECRYEIAASGSYWRLRDYAGQPKGSSLLIVAAPIKRPYIWDLTPSVSAIRYCLRRGLRIYLLEWLPDGPRNESVGLDEYAEAISECCARITSAGGTRPFLIGHSLGGTLAAISSALMPERIKGLVSSEHHFVSSPGQVNSETLSSLSFRHCYLILGAFQARSCLASRAWQRLAPSYGRD